MDYAIGKDGVGLTFQGSFPVTTPCTKCRKVSRLAFVLAESEPALNGPYICNLHNNGEDDKFWLHDAAAFATYLCTDIECATATTLWNQA